MARVLIFGTGRLALLAHHYLTRDGGQEVVGFVNPARSRPWKPVAAGEFEGLELVPLDDVDLKFPPEEVLCFAPSEAEARARGRQARYDLLKARGYGFVNCVHPSASIADAAVLGGNCLVQEQVTVQPFVRIGNDVVLGAGCHVGHHSTIGDHVQLGPQAVVCSGCTLEAGCVVGANATIMDRRRAGRETFVAAGAAVHENTRQGGVRVRK